MYAMYAYLDLFTIFIFIHPKWIELSFEHFIFRMSRKEINMSEIQESFLCLPVELTETLMNKLLKILKFFIKGYVSLETD